MTDKWKLINGRLHFVILFFAVAIASMTGVIGQTDTSGDQLPGEINQADVMVLDGALDEESDVQTAMAISGAGAMGPLRVHPSNPRYFADKLGKAVYLTGSHTWNNLQESWAPYFPINFNFTEYLNFLQQHNHNFIRLWRKEMPQVRYPDDPPGYQHATPMPWKRTGPGTAGDGQPKFDLTKFDPAHFDRLRSRCIAARNRGIYVSIMLFEGHDLQFAQEGWFSHPFKLSNNINGINGDPNNDGRGLETQLIGDNAMLNIQKAYIRKMIDTVNDLENVMYEISNESHPDSLNWQKHLVNYVHSYQANKPNQHPVLLSTTFPNVGGAIWSSNAEAVAPGNGDGDYSNNPPANSGSKVIIADSDHLFGCGGSDEWVWKSFMRGLNPIYMDSYYDDTPFCPPPIESIRLAMGQSNSLARRVDMAKMRPRNSHASTGYCLAELGVRYMIYAPGGGQFNVNLNDASGPLVVEWLNTTTGITSLAASTSGGATRTFSSPFGGSAVLFLYKPGQGGPGGSGVGGGAPANPAAGDQYGRAIANAGDVNCDGFDDLIVGAPFTNANGVQSGRAYIEVYSPIEGRFQVHYVFKGQRAGDRFGWSVASAGDVNGDGFADVVIGAPRHDQAGKNAGKIYVYSGRTGALLTSKLGAKAGDQFGYAVAGGIDINGGKDDFIVGAPRNDEAGKNAGAVYIYKGGSYQLIKKLRGRNAGDRFGWALAGVGRMNGDAYDDFVIAAPYNNDNGDKAGKVYVYAGKTYKLLYSKKGRRPGDRLGWSVAGCGRSDSDSRSDFVIGSPYYDAPQRTNAGRIDLISGANGKVHWSKLGQAAGDLFGYSVAYAGDVNSSGSGDIIVGAPNNDAAGSNVGRAYVYSGGNGSLLHVFDGQRPGERFGWAVAGVGDVDDDSHLEVTVGARRNDQNGADAGLVYLLTAPQ